MKSSSATTNPLGRTPVNGLHVAHDGIAFDRDQGEGPLGVSHRFDDRRFLGMLEGKTLDLE